MPVEEQLRICWSFGHVLMTVLNFFGGLSNNSPFGNEDNQLIIRWGRYVVTNNKLKACINYLLKRKQQEAWRRIFICFLYPLQIPYLVITSWSRWYYAHNCRRHMRKPSWQIKWEATNFVNELSGCAEVDIIHETLVGWYVSLKTSWQ
jgi:hypothetical protein